ncbi:MAG: hypothetical protein AABX49_02370 [Nanoarchaeota archaeon]
MKITEKRINSGLFFVIDKYLETTGIDEEPLHWFFSNTDALNRIKRISDYVLEYNPDLTRGFVEKMFIYYYSLGKEEYDQKRLL